MKKVIRLTETDLTRLIKRIISEREDYSDLEKEFDEFDEESSSDCEGLIQTMKFIVKDYMDSIETSIDEFDEADAEDIYDEFETELGGILDHANQMDCDDEIIQHLEILYNEYLSDMANKLGLR
jgi:superfamily I DNA/RNA helicase